MSNTENRSPPSELARDGDIKAELIGSCLAITLNRPDRLNALTRPMLHVLGDLLRAADADPRVHVVTFTGAGRAFCAGADVGSLKNSAETPLEQRLDQMPHFTPRHCGLFKPTICAVNGVCAGAGLHFVSDCDIVIAGQSASFVDSHVNVGQATTLEPIGLSRRIPLGVVLRMVILGKAERLDAARALACGMVSEVVPDAELADRLQALVALASLGSPAAIRVSLKEIWESYEPQLQQSYLRGYEAVMRHRDHPDALEGPKAFIEKRAPTWSEY